MDARALIREVIREAGALGLGRLERLVLIVALAFAVVMARMLSGRLVAGLQAVAKAFSEIKPETAPVMDEGGPQPPGVSLDTDPDHPGGKFPVSGG